MNTFDCDIGLWIVKIHTVTFRLKWLSRASVYFPASGFFTLLLHQTMS